MSLHCCFKISAVLCSALHAPRLTSSSQRGWLLLQHACAPLTLSHAVRIAAQANLEIILHVFGHDF